MTPIELRELLLYGPFNNETFEQLPSEVRGIWASQPNRREIDEAKRFMHLRVCLLVVGIIYLAVFYVNLVVTGWLVWIAASYEFSYFNLRSEKSELDYFLARERYSERVDDLLHKLYPRYEIDD